MANLFEGKTKREIMIEIGQDIGDQFWEDDIGFDVTLDLNSKKFDNSLLKEPFFLNN